jgi:NAD(P)-dependent dehydrogenase (short-subunit alcohol dehydrogenase family)
VNSTAPSSSPRVAIVTGANRGIGRAIALKLASEGTSVVLTARDAALLAEVAAEIRRAGGTALEVAGDLTNPELPGQIVAATLAAFGRVDIVVNNAGATKRGLFLELSESDWAEGFALKFFGAVRLLRAAWPHLRASAGSVVNIAGIGGRTPGAEFTIGGSVNAALLSLTKALADQGIADGVQVNAINPGRIKTDRLVKRVAAFAAQRRLSPAEAEGEMIADAGITRFGEPEEIAGLVAYLVSPAGRFFQGSLIDLDGGETKTF